ncbi:SRPBCC family protein [Bradyrhizobium sp.]|uniref:SRPBCC family protein n=1 Tax=Bradyrhizobium sp. TaxID=376 RepID=UPI001D685C3D|nr:SRPBCC family protein [Bradyrhizobium sp.]MBI5323632.1 SRPBCC family protein [Bradyrhizobium sp.]
MEASELGRISRVGNRFEARIERTLKHDQEAVWRMLTDSSLLPQWLAPGDLALSKGGAARLNFPESGTNVESVVTEVDPPRLIEYSWSSPGEPDRPLRWEAVATPGGTRLSLTLGIPDSEDIARTCAGWDAHLEMFAAAMEGVPIKFPFERFKAAREAYRTLVP